MVQGKVILLNGTTSSGKTTLSRRLLEKLPEQYHYLSVDTFMQMEPEWYLEQAFQHTIAYLSDRGIHTIVDYVLLDTPVGKELFAECLELLDDHPVLFVRVDCPLEELERRESQRGDRTPGQAKWQYEHIHGHGIYDLTVNTCDMTVDACADAILAKLDQPKDWQAFRTLKDRQEFQQSASKTDRSVEHPSKWEILPYQERWPSEFQSIAASHRKALGPLALRIDHIGSTSVPQLPAKDIIDIQITVAALDEGVLAAMASIGYTLAEGIGRDHRPPNFVGPDSDWEKWYFRPPPGQRRTHTHVRVQGRPNQRYALLFRDYLRAHPASAGAYAELKRRLAQHLADPQMYPEVKDPAVDLIYLAAEDWAAAAGWQPGPRDA